ncbi:alpha/beta hydrolase [Leifsonia shinshuensis]|uniref:alpha/beta hydrolase n=1 Tax=Leifsonia shinshuensis TaxID=150026 RepID=UPI00285E0C45|nr:alpha/beta hydrolase [Leifsonia shinshuensis]MDR6971766.1 pimeloyl-ACP methyl ester carboxylesterase [Leifsonia shinshuensis]
MNASRRTPRAIRNVAIASVSVVALVVVGFLAWASTPMMGDRAAALEAWRNPAVSIHDAGDAVVMEPTGAASGTGLVFVPGALVDPYAYLSKLSGAVEETGLTVAITKPTLDLAFFDQRPLSTFTRHAPDVDHWYVGGHSLGGVRACQLADDPEVEGLILFGSYCANDLSNSDLRVLSIGGGRDGLSTPAKIAAARHLLPADAELVEIAGMNHAQFGDYGHQPGDDEATISDADARAALTAALARFLR